MLRHRLGPLLVLVAVLPACSPSDPLEAVEPSPDDRLTMPWVGGDPAAAEQTIVFQSIRVLDARGAVVSVAEKGTLTASAWQRAARPWTHLDEAYLYHDQAWQRVLPDGTVEDGYRVIRTPNRAPPRRPSPPGLPEVGPGLSAARGRVAVILSLRDYPDWDIPLAPTSRFLAAGDRDAVLAERAAALRARRDGFAARASGVVEAIERAGGQVAGRGWGSGWLIARVPAGALRELALRPDLARIDALAGHAEQAQAEDATTPATGAYYTGEIRFPSRLDGSRFHAAGDSGEGPNPTRHGYGDVVIGLNELGMMEDEGCFLRDGNGCSSPSRLRERIVCDGAVAGDRCHPVADLPDIDDPGTQEVPGLCCTQDSDCSPDGSWTCSTATTLCTSGKACNCVASTCARHGTGIASIALGDYMGGEGDGSWVGDDLCTGPCVHGGVFDYRATGLAPEASLIFWGGHPTSDEAAQADSLAGAFAGATLHHVDVLNNAWIWNDAIDSNGDGKIDDAEKRAVVGTDCNPLAIRPFEQAAEDAYDDGVFVVAAAGNNPDGVNGACDIASPADVPKVFAVNGMPSALNMCGVDYKNCLVMPQAAATGGEPVTTPDGVLRSGALSGVAAALPTGMRFVTTERGDLGEVDEIRGFGGSSGASAVMSGAAALVKSFYLHRGLTFINDPGRLYTVMLAMTDRHFDATATQRTTGASRDWGFGRIKLRRLGPGEAGGRDAFLTTTVVPLDAAVTWSPFAAPLDAGTSLVKCVLLQEEDMSRKSIVSDVNLRVELRAPGAGGDCDGSGALVLAREDTSFDVKSLVAFTATDTTLAGRCVTVVAQPVQVAPPALTMHVMCYASPIRDDASLPDADRDDLPDADEAAEGTSPAIADSDGDGVSDGTEVYERRTSPRRADTDGDGVSDATDLVTFDHCTTRSLGAPRLIAPPPGGTTSDRPTFEWANARDTDGARLDVCADATCATVLATFDVAGARFELPDALPHGSTYSWRAFAEVGGDVGCWSDSATFTVPDEPPQVTVPGDLVAEATGPAGAAVSFVASASDTEDGALPVTCDPASGSTFPLGTTVVSCQAVDSHNQTASADFTITVRDTTAPALAVPASVAATATLASGAVVSYTATASDLVDGELAPSCSPPSGSLFAPGTTVVVCTATDAAGNLATASFPVSVTFSWSGIMDPIKPDGSSTFKLGSTIPVRFALTGASATISNGVFKLRVGTITSSFRYDAPTGTYVTNLSTGGLTRGTWQLSIDLGDGVTHLVQIRLK